MLRWLAYGHPAFMVLSLTVVFLALRAGLALRRSRTAGTRRPPDLRARHLRLARPGVAMVLVGLVGGPVSMLWLRGREPFETFHGAAGVAAALLFVAAAVLGRRIEGGRSRAFDAHAALALLAVLAAGVAAVAGFAILP